ncbi:hypothetical protein E4P41_10570 [Geodermatophilus sp. DF01-2]|nr:hypothetical protein E4P41_10570 [Geodermatophilus sp. DF01_2]
MARPLRCTLDRAILELRWRHAGVARHGPADGGSPIEVRDALIALPARRWSVVLSNPPFGRKSGSLGRRS